MMLLERSKKLGESPWLAVVLAVLGLVVVVTARWPPWSKVFENPEIVGVGLGLLGLGFGAIAFYVAWTSDERMKAMAKLEYFEKMAMVEKYLVVLRGGERDVDGLVVGAVEYDLLGAMALKKWVDEDMRKRLRGKVEDLVKAALNRQQPYTELVEALRRVQQKD